MSTPTIGRRSRSSASSIATPDAKVYGPPGVVAAAAGITVEAVTPGDEREAGGFALSFVGGKHAQVHESIPIVDNVGVIVDGTLYYPGDSFDLPGTEIAVLAVPSSGPWLKTGEAMDFIAARQAAPRLPGARRRVLGHRQGAW